MGHLEHGATTRHFVELPDDHEPEHDVKDTGDVCAPSFKAARDVDRQFQ